MTCSHRTCLLNVLNREQCCPECYTRIPFSAEPSPPPPPEPTYTTDERLFSEQDRHTYIAKLHDRWAKEARAMQFHDTAELHSMAARNHFEWATWNDEDEKDGFKVGMFMEAMKFRREAIEAEKRAKSADGELAWKESEKARNAAYKAALAEDMRR